MSASIVWSPVAKGTSLGVMAPSSFIKQLESAFGEFPVKLGPGSEGVIRGLKAASQEKEALEKIARAIDEHGEINLWAEY